MCTPYTPHQTNDMLHKRESDYEAEEAQWIGDNTSDHFRSSVASLYTRSDHILIDTVREISHPRSVVVSKRPITVGGHVFQVSEGAAAVETVHMGGAQVLQ